MLRQVLVEKGTGWHRYKSDVEPAPGYYFQIPGRPSEQQRKALGAQAVVSPSGRFCWLAPAEPWVQRLMVGTMDVRPWDYKAPIQWDRLPFNPLILDQLRDWQMEFVTDGIQALTRGHPYRRGAVVTLGGGKTLAGLLLCQLGDVSVVAASTYLHETWRSEAKKWGLVCPILTTYESIHKCPDPDVLVIDEVLGLKDAESKRHQGCLKKANKAQVVVGFTGTPTGGKGPMDWRWLRVIEPGCVPADERSWRFLFGKDTRVEEIVPGRSAYVTTQWHVDQVAKFVSPYVYSADTDYLMEQLPEVQYSVISVPTPRDWAMVAAGGATTTTASKRVAQCRQVSDGFVTTDAGAIIQLPHAPKLDAVCDWVEGLGEPVVLYAAWTGTIQLLAQRLAHHQPAIVTGETGDPGMEISRFKTGATRLMIANARFSQGMNLQEVCRIVAFVSWSLNPTDRKQAEGRVYRPGQTRGVQIVDFVCQDTLDQRTLDLIQGHQHLTEEQIEALLLKDLSK